MVSICYFVLKIAGYKSHKYAANIVVVLAQIFTNKLMRATK